MQRDSWIEKSVWIRQSGKAPLALLLSTLLLLGVIGWLAPASGLAKVLRVDRDGPPPFKPASLAWPRTLHDFEGAVVKLDAPPARVASQYWSIDEYLYAMLPPEDVVAVSETAYLEAVSNAYPLVQQHKPVVATDPERVLRTGPELVLVSSSARADFTALLRSAGVPVFRMSTTFTSLDQIASTIRLVGYLTGHDEQAQALYDSFQYAVGQARLAKPDSVAAPRVLGLGGRFSYGANTLFDDVARTVGAINVGAEGGLQGYSAVSSEQILRWDPEWIIISAQQGQQEQVRQRLLEDPAIAMTQAVREGRVLIYDTRIFLPFSPAIVGLLEQLPRDLYGG
jgi:iron complex transport system substrate-binding protein